MDEPVGFRGLELIDGDAHRRQERRQLAGEFFVVVALGRFERGGAAFLLGARWIAAASWRA